MSDQNEFENRVGRRLRDSADELDGATRSRLNQARQRALAELEPGRARRGAWQWLPLGASAAAFAAALIAVGLWRGGGAPDTETLPVAHEDAVFIEVADFELLLDDSDFEMIEDIDFYAWLPDDLPEVTVDS